jgi:hypothetical protein
MTLPEIHDSLQKSLGSMRYTKESSIWGKVLHDLDDSVMSVKELLLKCVEAKKNYDMNREKILVSLRTHSKDDYNNPFSQASIPEGSGSGAGESDGMQV